MFELLKSNQKLLGAAVGVLGPTLGGLMISGKLTLDGGQVDTVFGAVMLMGSLVAGALLALAKPKAEAPKP